MISKESVMAYALAGYTIKQTAELLNVSYKKIWQISKDYNIKFNRESIVELSTSDSVVAPIEEKIDNSKEYKNVINFAKEYLVNYIRDCNISIEKLDKIIEIINS